VLRLTGSLNHVPLECQGDAGLPDKYTGIDETVTQMSGSL
jgi:hypothetical protein